MKKKGALSLWFHFMQSYTSLAAHGEGKVEVPRPVERVVSVAEPITVRLTTGSTFLMVPAPAFPRSVTWSYSFQIVTTPQEPSLNGIDSRARHDLRKGARKKLQRYRMAH
jgi:hypothetical protein